MCRARQVTVSCPVFVSARALQLHDGMRDTDEEDPSKPRPVRRPPKKQTTATEYEVPWQHLKDAERDRHRHVC